MNSKKLFAGVIALAIAGAVVAPGAQAATAEELAAQIAQLQTELLSLQGQVGTTPTTGTGITNTNIPACAGITFSRNLTIGSQGNDVKCLQSILNANPTFQVAFEGAGSPNNETMYFGGLTKNAVIKFQDTYAAEILAPVGLTGGTGFVGASTRAKLNAILAGGVITGGTGTTGTNLPTGCTSTTGYSPVTGASCASATTGGTGSGVTQTGAEGSITVSINPTPSDSVKLYEGDAKMAVYGAKIKATGSDVDVQRMTLQFSAQPYSYFSNVYLYDGDTEVASSALNSTTVSKVSSSDYEITLSGFTSKVIIPKDTSKVLTVKVDVLSGISSGLVTAAAPAIVLVGTPSATSIRAVDQAGLNQYGGVDYVTGTTTTYRTFTVNASQSTNATLSVSTNANTPKSRNVIADSSNAFEKVTLLAFDVKATKDTLLVDQINNVLIANGTSTPSTSAYTLTAASSIVTHELPTTVYLVDDAGTVIGTASPSAAASGDLYQVDFTDLNYTIAKDTTKTLTIKIDDTLTPSTTNGATSTDDGDAYQVAVYANQFSVEKSNGATLATTSQTGLANGNDAVLYTQGPIFTLASISTTSTQSSYSGASSTISATFNIQVAATTGDVYIPDTGAFNLAETHDNGVTVTEIAGETYSQPSGTVDAANGAKIPQGTSVTYAVSATKSNGGIGAATFSLRAHSIIWGHTDVVSTDTSAIESTYMQTDSAWYSSSVYLQ
jgi:hypothetical protein